MATEQLPRHTTASDVVGSAKNLELFPPVSLRDALKGTVDKIGSKAVAAHLWPDSEKPTEDVKKLRHCLNEGRAEKLNQDQIQAIIELGRDHGVYDVLRWLSEACHATFNLVSREDHNAKVVSQLTDVTRMLLNRLEALQ